MLREIVFTTNLTQKNFTVLDSDLISHEKKLKLAFQVMSHQQIVSCAIQFAELVLHIYEKEYPKDNGPRKAIESAKIWLKNPTEKNRKAAFSASASASASAAYANAAASASANAAATYASAAAASAAYASRAASRQNMEKQQIAIVLNVLNRS